LAIHEGFGPAVDAPAATRTPSSPRKRGKTAQDFAIFWSTETDPAAKRQFLSLISGGVWLDRDRVVAVQPKPSFLLFFEDERSHPRDHHIQQCRISLDR
jgi:hypothetical protein